MILDSNIEDVRGQATGLLDLIVQRKFDLLQEISGGTFEARSVQAEVDSYPAAFVSNPDLSASSMRISPMAEGRFRLDIQMCSEEGLEDLTLRCVIEPQGESTLILPYGILVP